MRIEELMREPVVSCRAGDTAAQAAELMWNHDVGVLPVLGDDHRVVGVVTDRDLCMEAYTQGKPLADLPVAKSMSTALFSCRPSDPVDVAERLMREKQVHRLPVIDPAGKLVGMVSLNDLARNALSWRPLNGLGEGVLQTLAAVSSPRKQGAQATAPWGSAPHPRFPST